MKQITFKPLGSGFRMFALLFFVAIAATSCQKQINTNDEAMASRSVEMASNKPGNSPIAQVAIDNGFTQLVAALMYVDEELNAGLVNLFMNGKDQYTVFAPTDAAFQNLYAALTVKLGTPIDEITDLPATLVLDVLKYHVTGGRRASFSVLPKKGMREITTLLPNATFSVSSSGMITAVGSTAQITAADVNASNGIIHIIDEVLLPIVP
ncbi:MAG: fasciclin domain-containing protein [Bacteroidota bacterium]